MTQAESKVWDPLVRIGHWALVIGVIGAWLTRKDTSGWHEWVGYACLLVVALRLVWGVAGSRYARFAQFIRGPRSTLHYAQLVLAAREPRYVGHNPLGAWMVVALLGDITATGVTGWAMTTDAFWGDPLMSELHESLAISLLVFAAFHVAGVVLASKRHGENLAASMVTGRKRAPSDDDVA